LKRQEEITMPVAPSQAKTAFGAKWSLAASTTLLTTNTPGTTEWGEVTALTPPGDTSDTAEVTHFQSDGSRREYIKTLIDSGEADIEVNLVPGGLTDIAMQAASLSRDVSYYSMLLPKAGGTFWKISGQCLVTGFSRTTPIGEAMKATARIKFTGQRTEAALP
jgi:hypothetical protein